MPSARLNSKSGEWSPTEFPIFTSCAGGWVGTTAAGAGAVGAGATGAGDGAVWTSGFSEEEPQAATTRATVNTVRIKNMFLSILGKIMFPSLNFGSTDVIYDATLKRDFTSVEAAQS